MSKVALCRISDTEPLLSIVPMLEAAGYECVLPDRSLRNFLRDIKCGNVDEFADMKRRWGAEMPSARYREVGLDALDKVDLYVDVNGCGNGPKVWERYPRLRERTLCYFINGGEPRNTPDKGDNQTPACPMVTTAQHYRSTLFCPNKHWNVEAFSCDAPPNPRGYWTNRELSKVPSRQVNFCSTFGDPYEYDCPHGCGPLIPAPWTDKVYVFWPSFNRQDRLGLRTQGNYLPPVSFVHNCLSWGCQEWVEPARKLGVLAYGGGNSPDGMIPHEDVFAIFARALCVVYLKGGGAVDYSMLEPMFTGCPFTCHEAYLHNCRLYDLLEPGVTCLTWKDADGIKRVIEQLSDPAENRRIGEAGRKRAAELCWGKDKDVTEFKAFMTRLFP